jgi:type I restriction enzyme S subunit
VGWASKRLKYVATHNDEVLPESTDDLTEIDYVEISGVSLTGGLQEINRMTFFEAPSRARRKVRSGDILISTVRTYLRAIAAVEEASDDLIASTGFCVVRPGNDADSAFLGWVAKSEPFVSEIVARSVGVSYPAINSSELVTIEVPLPPLETQQRIARFLDEKTAQIDGLIEKKRALLDRLAEKRQALITRAVTKGLNPSAPLKPSGIDWLGDIPAHWKMRRLRWYMRIRSGEALRNEDMSVEATDIDRIPVIGGNGIMGFTSSANSTDVGIIVGRVGALCGNVHAVPTDSWITDNALGISRVRCFDLEYLIHQLRLRDLNALATRNAQPLMTGEVVKAQSLASPPLNEQQKISAYIDVKSRPIQETEKRIAESITHLTEYRAALITAAVTGMLEI